MRNKFAEIIYKESIKNSKYVLLLLIFHQQVRWISFRTKYPKDLANTGVAEQSMIGIAAGMALRGLKPFCYTIATFSLYRPLEMIRVDLCYQNLPVTSCRNGD